MSREAWGDENNFDGGAFEAAIEAGWIDPTDQTKALIDVMNERDRQHNEEGWTPDHDDQHIHGELAKAAACYASFAGLGDRERALELYAPGSVFTAWPWLASWWKPSSRRRDLVKAAALILAEIERLDRGPAVETTVAPRNDAPSPIKPEQMPAPDTLVQSHSGQVMPAMFWFAIEGQSLHDIASEHGFEISFHDIIAGAGSEEAAAALEAQYVVNPDGMLAEFVPDAPPTWQYGGKWHGEDGPVACFLRKREAK